MNKTNFVIDHIFIFSLGSLIPLGMITNPTGTVVVLLILVLSLYKYYQNLNRDNIQKKVKQIESALSLFLQTKDYDQFKSIMYKYPMLTFFLMHQNLGKDFILNLKLSELNCKEFKPEPKTISNLITYFELKQPQVEDVDSGEFLGEFIHFNFDN